MRRVPWKSLKTSLAALPSAIATLSAAVLAMVPAAAALGAASPATQPNDSDLRAQVQQMRIEIDRMHDHEAAMEKQLAATTQPSAPMTAQMHADQERAVDAVYQDALQRSRLLTQMPMGAGYDPDHGFFIASDDGNFRLHPFVLLQVRDYTAYRHNNTGSSDNTQNGFEVRRLQLGVDGNVYNPDLTYKMFIQNDHTSGDLELKDAWVKYHFPGTPWSIEGGQFKAPLDREALVYDRTMMAVDRTLTDDILAGAEAFSDGVMGIYDPGTELRVRADFTNGYNNNNANFEDPPNRTDNFGVGARGDFKFMGKWKDYDQMTSLHDQQDLLIVGGGFDWSEASSSNALRHVIDVQYNTGGLGLYAAYLGRYTGNGNTPDSYDASIRAQASYLIENTSLEPFLRYDFMRLDPNEFTGPTNVDTHEITAGANYYFYGQNCKLTLDVEYLPNGSPVDDNGSGVLVNQHTELILRAQFQLAI
jgi:hypothetical protein